MPVTFGGKSEREFTIKKILQCIHHYLKEGSKHYSPAFHIISAKWPWRTLDRKVLFFRFKIPNWISEYGKYIFALSVMNYI